MVVPPSNRVVALTPLSRVRKCGTTPRKNSRGYSQPGEIGRPGKAQCHQQARMCGHDGRAAGTGKATVGQQPGEHTGRSGRTSPGAAQPVPQYDSEIGPWQRQRDSQNSDESDPAIGGHIADSPPLLR
jgi:hypothetical protein